MNPRSFRLLIVITAALALLGTACGDDNKKDNKKREPKATVSSECKAPGVTPTGVEVAVVSSQSGAEPAGQFRPFHLGVLARFALENAGSGIDGRGLSAEVADDGNTAERNLKLAKDLVESKRLYGLIEASPSASASAKYLHDKGVPVVGLPITPEWDQYDNMFGYNTDGADPLADWQALNPDLPEYAEFKDWLARTSEAEPPGKIALAGWLSADIFVRGLHEAGVECPLRRDFIEKLRDQTKDGS